MSNELIRELVEAVEAARKAHESLFTQCLTNGVFTQWGQPVDCTALNEAGRLASYALIAKARAYLETGEWNVSDVMLCGMLRMPLEMHLADDVFGPPQLQSRMLEAADELEKRANRIAELERENEALRKDAERYRWLRDQHEGLMPMEIDADGDLMPRELRALAFTVFYPDPSERESLVPVPIGDLDETIDAAIKENHAD